MFSNPTIVQISQTGERYAKVYNDLVANFWSNHCGCSEPGLIAKCQTCPLAIKFIQRIQQEIDPERKLGMIKISPPELIKPYSEKIKQRCVSMYELGYSLTQIKEFTGVTNVVELRHWLKDSGIYKSAKDYLSLQKQQCLDLYLQGKTPLEIEEEMRISGFVISNWIYKSGISTRPQKTRYSKEQQNLALSMYVEGESYSKIKSATSVPPDRVEKLVARKKVDRKRKPKVGRPTVYSSAIKKACLDMQAQGQTPIQIEQLTGVSAGSIRIWQKNCIAQTESNL